MKPNQKLTNKNGVEVMLFPLEYMNISQDEGGDFSHAGSLNMDFLGWGKNGRILNCPYYAPVSIKCVKQSTKGAYNIWESINPVLLADGTISYVTIMCVHDENLLPLGTILTQGEVMGHTGKAGHATGDHLHLNIAKGKYAGQEQVPPKNVWQLKNSIHVYDGTYVNDTVIVNGKNHPWKIYDKIPPLPPTSKRKNKFNWVLYARKLRNK